MQLRRVCIVALIVATTSYLSVSTLATVIRTLSDATPTPMQVRAPVGHTISVTVRPLPLLYPAQQLEGLPINRDGYVAETYSVPPRSVVLIELRQVDLTVATLPVGKTTAVATLP